MTDAQTLTRALTIRYVTALVIIALVVTGTFITTYSAVNTGLDASATVNLAGRQRMLSQRISLQAHLLVMESNQVTVDDLDHDIERMHLANEFLVRGTPHPEADSDIPILRQPSEETRQRLIKADALVSAYLDMARKIVERARQGQLDATDPDLASLNALSSGPLLDSLEAFVSGLQKDNEHSVRRILLQEAALWVLALASLVLVALWILAPIVRRVGDQIRETNQGRRSLMESEERFALAAKGASVGIWDWVDVNGDREVWSDQFYRLLGYEPGEIEATLQNFQAMLHPDDQDVTVQAVGKHFEQREPFSVEYRLRGKDGNYRWFLGSGQAVWDEGGKPRRMIGSIMDIHDRKLAENLKNEFVSTVSHELRTPMTSIMGAIELTRSGQFGYLPERVSELLEVASDNGRRLVRLINDILDIDRMESGQMTFESERIVVSDVVEAAVQQNRGLLEASDNRLRVSDRSDRAAVIADFDRLLQVLTNLLSNAGKFSPPESPIVLRAFASDHEVIIEVMDEGIGIPQDQQQAIFNRFVQVDSGDSRAQQGTGLGLAISKAIVVTLKGQLEVESEVGEGSTFRVRLPRAAGHDAPAVRLEPPEGKTNSVPRVLLVEDEPADAALLQRLLEGVADVTRAGTVAAARQAVDTAPPDLIVLDLVLPDEGGEALVDHLATQGQDIPVIVYSLHGPRDRTFPGFVRHVFVKNRVSDQRLRQALMAALLDANPQDGA